MPRKPDILSRKCLQSVAEPGMLGALAESGGVYNDVETHSLSEDFGSPLKAVVSPPNASRLRLPRFRPGTMTRSAHEVRQR
jgi:hypothetical protein